MGVHRSEKQLLSGALRQGASLFQCALSVGHRCRRHEDTYNRLSREVSSQLTQAFLSQLKSPECAPIVALLRKQVDAIVSCRKTDEVGDRFQKAVDASCSALARQATLKHVPAELLTEHTEAFIAAKVAPHVLRLVETTPLRLEDQRLQKNLNVLRVFGLTLTQLEVDELLLPHKLRAPLLSMVGELLAATKANTVGKVSNVEAGPSFSSRLAPKLQSSGSECHRVCP